MGTGSSREGKARTFSPPHHWRGPGPGRGSHSAPPRQCRADDGEAEYARVAGQSSPLVPSLQLEQPDSDSELLDQVLEECEEDSPRLLPTAAPRWPPYQGSGDCCSRPAEGGGEEIGRQREAAEGAVFTALLVGSSYLPNQPALGISTIQQDIPILLALMLPTLGNETPARKQAQRAPRTPHVNSEGFLTRSTPGNNNFANQLPLKKPERQAKISYDCSEEELMATIEQEYCR